MISIQHAGKFSLNAYGTALCCGYETVRHIDLLTGVETPWHRNGQGAWYPGGWEANGFPIVFTPTHAAPPMTQARLWVVSVNDSQPWPVPEAQEHAIGHGDLMVYPGDVLSTNGFDIWHNGVKVTPPEPFSGVVWSGKDYYGYAPVNKGSFMVRGLSTKTSFEDVLGAGQCPYSIGGVLWVSGYEYGHDGIPGGVTVHSLSEDEPKFIPGEIPGPIFEKDGTVYVVTGIMGAGQNPRGVMVRPWDNFSAQGKGWWCPGINHQMLQARVRQDGYVVVAGTAFPGDGTITIEAIEPGRPMVTVPPETGPIDPPIDPPPTGGEMTAAECKVMLDQMEARLNVRIDAVGEDVEGVSAQCMKLNELARAKRDGTVGSLFGTQPMTIKPNVTP